MTNKQIELMLKDVVREVDSDVFTGLYVSPEEPSMTKELRKTLIEIVRDHMGD
jgi:hypothetical protein